MTSLYKFCETLRERERERERDKCFVASISLQQRKHFITIRALSDLASGGSANSNEAHTYHCGRYAKNPPMLKLVFSLELRNSNSISCEKLTLISYG